MALVVQLFSPCIPAPLNMHKSGFLHGPTAQSARECEPRTHAGPVLAFVTPPPCAKLQGASGR